MFLELISFLTEFDPGFDVLRYLTVRAVLAMLAALFISLTVGHFFIARLQHYQIGQVIRTDGPERYANYGWCDDLIFIHCKYSYLG